MYDSETHRQTRTYACTGTSRSDLLQHIQGVFQTCFSVLLRLRRLNCCKPTNFRFSRVPRPSRVDPLFKCLNDTGRHQLQVGPALSIIVSSTLWQGLGHWPVVNRQGIMENARTVHAACICRSVGLTVDVLLLVLFIKTIKLSKSTPRGSSSIPSNKFKVEGNNHCSDPQCQVSTFLELK